MRLISSPQRIGMVLLILLSLIVPVYGLEFCASVDSSILAAYGAVPDDGGSAAPVNASGSRGTSARTEFDIKLNELMLFPTFGGPWIEIYNQGTETINMNHWLISDMDTLSYTFDETVTDFKGGSYAVLHFDSGTSESGIGVSQPNAIHIYTGWTNVRWTEHAVDSVRSYARAAIGFDIMPGGNPEILANVFAGSDIYFYEPKADMTQEWTRFLIDEAGATYRIVPIDIDADGHEDIVYNYYFGGDQGGKSLHWIKGPDTNAKANWGGPFAIDSVRRPEGLDAGNISNDSKMDLVVGSEFESDIYWYKSPNDPVNEPWTRYTLDNNIAYPGGLKLEDIDGDSDLDVAAVGSYGADVVWYEHPSDPNGAWTKYKINRITRCSETPVEDGIDRSSRAGARNEFDPIGEIAVYDMDLDACPDVVVTEPKRDRIVWYKAPPDPKNAAMNWLEFVIDDNITSPSGLDIGDFDGDSLPDVAATSTAGSVVWYQHPSMQQMPVSKWKRYTVSDSVHLALYVNAADFDGDGDLDLVTADQNDGRIIWYENDHVSFSSMDQCGLFEGPDMKPNTIMDFVAWGGTAGTEERDAVLAGIWQIDTFVPLPGSILNSSIARDMFSTDTNTISDWEVPNGINSDIPTPGTMNYPSPINSKPIIYYDPVVFNGAFRAPATGPPLTTPPNLVLANYSSYTLNLNVTNPFGALDLNTLELSLNPGGAAVTLGAVRIGNTLNLSLADPLGYVTLVPDSCTATTDHIYNWQVNFTLIFDWDYPTEAFQAVSVYSGNGHGHTDEDTFPSLFRVVKSLNFTGALELSSLGTNAVLKTNSYVVPGERISVRGIGAVYDVPGGAYYPSDGQFDVMLTDSELNTWIDYTSAGYAANFTIDVPEDRITGAYTLSLALTNLCKGAISRGSASMQVMIDAGPVRFDLPSPDGAEWHTQDQLICSVRITDAQPESGVLGSSIAYRLANGTVDRFGEWIGAPQPGTGAVLEPAVICNFTSGPNNWIQWCATDVAWNRIALSEPYRVPVDRTGVSYPEFYPLPNLAHRSTNITVHITIADFGGSGVNLSTVSAALRPSGADMYGDWYDLGLAIENETAPVTTALRTGPESVRLSALITSFRNGTDNFIKFRAMDVAMNNFTESPEYRITVDLRRPELQLTLFRPENDSILHSAYPVLKWQPVLPVLFDKLYYYVYLTTDRSVLDPLTPPAQPSGTAATALLATVPGSELELDLAHLGIPPLAQGVSYYWTVIPVLEPDTEHQLVGVCTDGIFEFRIYLAEYGLEFSADPLNAQIYTGTSVRFALRIRNVGLVPDNFTLNFAPSGGLIITLDRSILHLDAGVLESVNLTVHARDGQAGGRYAITVRSGGLESGLERALELEVTVITKSKEPHPPEETVTKLEKASWGLILVLLLILIALIVLTVVHVGRARNRIGPVPMPEEPKRSTPKVAAKVATVGRPVAIVPKSVPAAPEPTMAPAPEQPKQDRV